jgi:hypothetical protein
MLFSSSRANSEDPRSLRAVLSRKVSMPKNWSLFFYELEPLACTRVRIVLSNKPRNFWREDQTISQYLRTTHETADIIYAPCGIRALTFLFTESCSVLYFVATAVDLVLWLLCDACHCWSIWLNNSLYFFLRTLRNHLCSSFPRFRHRNNIRWGGGYKVRSSPCSALLDPNILRVLFSIQCSSHNVGD